MTSLEQSTAPTDLAYGPVLSMSSSGAAGAIRPPSLSRSGATMISLDMAEKSRRATGWLDGLEADGTLKETSDAIRRNQTQSDAIRRNHPRWCPSIGEFYLVFCALS